MNTIAIWLFRHCQAYLVRYFQLFTYLVNSSLLCVEWIKFLVLIMFLFEGRGRLKQLPVQPCGWPGAMGQRTAKQEGELLAPNVVISVVMQGYVSSC